MNRSIKLITILFFSIALFGQTDADRKAVEAAVADYVDALYKAETNPVDRSVDVTLRKYGYWFNKKSGQWSQGSEMNFKQLRNLSASWNKDGKRDTSIREIKILDMLDKTASAKLVASWGIDYFHLSKQDGEWKIVNIIWQSHPPKE